MVIKSSTNTQDGSIVIKAADTDKKFHGGL